MVTSAGFAAGNRSSTSMKFMAAILANRRQRVSDVDSISAAMGRLGCSATRGLGRLGLAFAIGLAAVAFAAPAGAAGAVHRYVALGDSYTAGPLIPNPTGEPIDCGRSTNNYPHVVARAIHPAVFRDVSCGSATTKDMTMPQTGLPLGGTNPPQFDALGRRVGLEQSDHVRKGQAQHRVAADPHDRRLPHARRAQR